jgi:hypothetical protein
MEFLVTELGLTAAPLLVASALYTDLPHLTRRRHDMDLAAEMQWSLLPPLSFTVGGATIAGLLQPAYEVGGDCFDYAFNGGNLDFVVLDTVGHGLPSAVLAALMIGAYRHGRRAGDDLAGLATRMSTARVRALTRWSAGHPNLRRTHLGRPARRRDGGLSRVARLNVCPAYGASRQQAAGR